jgi:RHS repeat-associated protein
MIQSDYTQPDVKYTLIGTAGGDDPDTGDIYRGLDRFGRIKDSDWYNYGTSADADRIKYGYDRSGSRIWRENTVARSQGKYFDEKYLYDQIDRLKDMSRGELGSGGSTLSNKQFAQCWGLDETGNWSNFREDNTGAGSWTLNQSRTSNTVNEITDITETVGASWVTPVYSRAGNMTTMPQPASPASSYTATYDAWNRLVKIADGANTVSEYQYDGAKRRVVQKSYVSGTLNETRHLYYTEPGKWQVVEERVGTSSSANRQFVWGLRYIDDLILRDRDTDGNGTLDERLYSLQDANWNVTGLVNTSGVIQQRFVYTAYGLPVFLSSSFTSGSNTAAWEVLYAGYRFETATSLMHVRHRVLNPALGGWVQRDPVGYADGESLYMYVRGSALTATDKSGLFGPVVLGCLGGLIGGGISHLIDYIKGSATGCEAIMSTLCSTGIGCIVGALVTALEFDPTWAAFFACAGIGAIVGLLSQLCQAAAHGFCLLFECDAKEMTLSCFLADVIASGLGTGLNCAFPVGGAAAVLAFMLGLDIGLVPSLLC